jgi:O-antigen/teichoic acid export membrane protein
MSVSITDKILRNTGWNFIARIIHIPVSIGLIPFIIGRVGLDWYGIWVALFAIVDYVSLLDMGVGAATIKYVAEYQAFGNSRKIGNVVLSTCLFNLVFLPPLVLAHVFAAEILSIFQIAPKDFGDARLIFDWVLLNFAAAQISGVFRNTLIGLQRMHVSNLCEIAYLLAYTASTVIVLGAGAGLTGLIVVLFALR